MNDNDSLRGRCAVVTGAARGIGRATALALAGAGVNVAGFSLGSAEERETTLDAVLAKGVEGLMIEGDAGDPGAVEDFASTVDEHWGGPDIWINNAAIELKSPIAETTDRMWREVMRTNVDAYFFGARAAAKRMMRQGSGRIINVSSVTRRQPVSGLAAYVTSKGAVTAMTSAMAVELAEFGITVNAIAPGAVDTPLPAFSEEQRAAYAGRIPLGRIAAPGDIAAIAVFLASDAARYVTGHELLADGGLSINGNVGPRE
jgi:NAD(P)-dependent dehydrogenase (short-subunit alcohol dehydrogenase family)